MKKTALIIASFLLLLGGVFVASRIHAQESLQVLPLTVVPPKQEVLINPGEKFSTSVKFLNQADSPVTGSLYVLDFVVEDNVGTPMFLDNPQVVGTTQIPAKYSAAKWISIPDDTVTIASKGNISVPITINVPKTAVPGGRYAAVLFQPATNLTMEDSESALETPITVRLASLIYIRVAGPISESATVTKFEGPKFLEYGPASITTQILNQGNYHISPQGDVTLKDIFGRVVAKSKLDARNIFPGTSRVYTNELGQKLMIGKFTTTLNATYGDTGKLLTASFVMWVLPWRIMLAILLALIIIALTGTMWYKRIKKKEEKLVEELKEEKTELEELKEELKDKVAGEPTPKEETK
ncbi:MAG: hypothetical protein UV71_C0002G0005 [Microgenomates group bacterium GW2011_GWC1_43_13]|uniref:DUF916 domain-containing protein n=2 Tax=Candidatus Woeseibacteriota TaxID=1752722 RepID=A0A837I9F0_9BACT|nr:MAG: hypothetical protein UV71_C0002G0005 [Microgenomates group bacterium GW2011_GWC1_43_13]KKT54489.1 MAG: hypothetical protein UW47_C0005G0037 [Candidatus Woesebacteria bacterium GW2011_GWA1_44_23]OGM82028.1 MAG: hypothetical protein A2394_02895 [Candidatus Woesebacteria bacterium RIFOXYB1_FULL_42_36]OGM84726.1 MAG: hypothetical protein A2421_02890 [Candidatus Woesebacteria bacterium RIFOXYC1_FULL_43_18]OGM87735.1 MAG: hypothetical protein A2573_00515 [Candidatus Woesebacteria bacterium RI